MELGHELRRLPGTRGVLSAVDLVEPEVAGRHQLLVRILRDEVLADPTRLAARLGQPPFTTNFQGFLYDRDLTTFVMVVTPPYDDQDPRASLAFMHDVAARARRVAEAHGVAVIPGGDYFLHQEVRRVAVESQGALTTQAVTVLVVLFWMLFGTIRVALQVFLLLGLSVFFGFVAMAVLGLPVTFMSINLAVMVIVIGTADLVHILGRMAALRRDHGPREAALRAGRETSLPVLLTSLTTAGCLLATSATPLALIRDFSLALSAGVMVTWAVAVVYGPLLFQYSGVEAGRGLYFELEGWLAGLRPESSRQRRRRLQRVRWGFLVAGVALLGMCGMQRVDSNWYRYFPPEAPVSRVLEFLEAQQMPRSIVDCTIEVDTSLFETLADADLERDVARLAEEIARLPGVMGVEHLFSQHAATRQAIAAVEYPPEVSPFWAARRREALVRQFAFLGLYDRYFGQQRNQVRLEVASSLEGSSDLQGLREAIQAKVRALDLARIRLADFGVTGQMHYWSAIMASIPRTFLASAGGCLLVVFLAFWLLTGSARLGFVALAPNVLPVLAMLGFGWALGIPLNENLVFAVSLAIGVAVDDTLHVLYHYRSRRAQGDERAEAMRHAFVVAGAPVVSTSLLLLAGFAVCLTSRVTPIWQLGALLAIAVASALAADLWLLPALLEAFDDAPAGSQRDYGVSRPVP